MEQIAMKKPKTVVDLLTIDDVCIEASEARTQLLESHSKGQSRKNDDWEVNTAGQGDQIDHRDLGYCGKQSSDQKEKRSF
jgi:hypothetical protein